MPLGPRFRRAALSRPFVDRLGAIAAFDQSLAGAGAGPRVLNVTGVGGIGKSRLLRELQGRAEGRGRWALLDLQLPALRDQDAALATLRIRLGAQGVRFDRFDLSYAALWQRLHPHLRLTPRELPLIQESELLADIADGVAGIPVFGTVVGLVKLLERSSARVRRWRSLRQDPTLAELDELPNAELIDAVTYLFAEDLRDATAAARPYVLFVDGYEALVAGHLRAGRAAAPDVWLRDLLAQLDRGLTVVASREPLRWEAYAADWSRIVTGVALDDLPMDARLELLEVCGVADGRERRRIAEASAGVPFYLHLAVDTRDRDGGEEGPAVSPEQLRERFLQHVDAGEVRSLELLSAARMFDFGIFQAVTRRFGLPDHRLAWESLTAYSFVYPAGGGRVQLHQLMTAVLSGRLSAEVAGEVHRLLRSSWEARAAAGQDAQDAGGQVVEALREAVHHGLLAGEVSGEELLRSVDRIAAAGGTQGVTGVLRDVQVLLAEQPAPPADLALAARCIEVERTLLVGDTSRAAELTPDAGAPASTPVGARLAVAGGNARRILGRTTEALRIYDAVWRGRQTAERLIAGLWAADLHMAQGRFRAAVELANEVRRGCPDDRQELLGDLSRLLHLTYRFAFDHDRAAGHLDTAAGHYRAAGTVIGLANVATNRTELLAWTDPAGAVAHAQQAAELQRELGALPEIGKIYTAVALAHVRLDELARADAALDLACDALERAGYRSGRARAELVRAARLARGGDLAGAAGCARQGVRELEAAEVYPTLVLAAATLLDLVDVADPEVTAAAARARAGIQPIDPSQGPQALQDRMAGWVAVLVGRQLR
ncbi:MAG TPA: aminoglycoside phosphotransferase family protein [Actinomycetes bacterium]|nr:aminoglycoside phosphotransferase family protein [Actinomycetes bacterium]